MTAWTQSLFTLAQARIDAGKYEAAIDLLERAWLEGESGEVLTAHGWALETLGRYSEARQTYERAIEHDPNDCWAQEGLANILWRLGDRERAARLYRSVVERIAPLADPAAEELELRGWCQHRLGRHEDAETSFRRALELEPDRVTARFDLALTLLHLSRPGEGLAEYMRALRTSGERERPVAVAHDDLETAIRDRPSLREYRETAAALALLIPRSG